MMTMHEPNSAREATMRSPLPHSAANAMKTAETPVAVANAASAPSSSRIRSSNIATVGLP